MLTRLEESSHRRLSNDQNFQFFLKVASGYKPKRVGFHSRRESMNSNFGVEDLQMKEAVEIVKDMVLINLAPSN